jgi:hypothetical protein
MRPVVRIDKHSLAIGLAAIALAASPAAAQPGLAPAPGRVPPPGGHLPQHHAVPPLPQVYPSPMPTLPPPSSNAPIEPTIGFAIGTVGFTAVVNPDGSIQFDDEGGSLWAGVDPILGLAALLQFDATDGAMRAARFDPYLPQKLSLMKETFEERIAMRRVHDRMVMQRALDDLPRYLDAVWSERSWTAGDRRRILFALWDEAAEDGNELLVAGGTEARRLIEEFISYRLPPGSRYAFRTGELVQLNRIRTSRQSFAPYSMLADGEDDPATVVADSPTLVAALRTF